MWLWRGLISALRSLFHDALGLSMMPWFVVFLKSFLSDMLHTPTSSKPTAGVHVVHPHHLGNRVKNTYTVEPPIKDPPRRGQPL